MFCDGFHQPTSSGTKPRSRDASDRQVVATVYVPTTTALNAAWGGDVALCWDSGASRRLLRLDYYLLLRRSASGCATGRLRTGTRRPPRCELERRLVLRICAFYTKFIAQARARAAAANSRECLVRWRAINNE